MDRHSLVADQTVAEGEGKKLFVVMAVAHTSGHDLQRMPHSSRCHYRHQAEEEFSHDDVSVPEQRARLGCRLLVRNLLVVLEIL